MVILNNLIKQFQTLDDFRNIDLEFAKFILKLAKSDDINLFIASALVSRALGDGNTCINLKDFSSIKLSSFFNIIESEDILLPDLKSWTELLTSSHVVTNDINSVAPLYLDDNGRLYLYRLWLAEYKLAENLIERITTNQSNSSENNALLIDKYFSKDSKDLHQRLAAEKTLQRNFSIITGGPGTGKTTTVLKILALFLEQNINLKIALAAPTGKAATRLNESLSTNLKKLPDQIAAKIPVEAQTIHRLLKYNISSETFFYNKNNQLNYDLIVIDESSMIDLSLMQKLTEAIPLTSKIILLGDSDQLASVESGMVFGNLCATALLEENIESKLSESINTLSLSHRFSNNQGIGKLSYTIKNGEISETIKLLESGNDKDIIYLGNIANNKLNRKTIQLIVDEYTPYLQASTPEEALLLNKNFIVLTPLRQGRLGVNELNSTIERELTKSGLIETGTAFYHGMPVMITQNNYSLNLYNGDIGLILNDKDDSVKACYPAANGEIRYLSPGQLPLHEKSYAITIHKSQGSEFRNVLIIIPDKISPVMKRELLYTAVTRAREKVFIAGSIESIKYMIENPIVRNTGLQYRLMEKMITDAK